MGNSTLKLVIINALVIALVFCATGFYLRKKPKELLNLHQRYLVPLVRLVIIILCLANVFRIFNPDTDVNSLLIKGSALIVAIVGFAGQTAIADLICGFLISVHKPFEIGDRIIVEGLDPGIVEDITLRHTVLRIYDGIKIVVPNSQLNSKTVINTSYRMGDRLGIHLKFNVSYDTDVTKAIELIRDCVTESPYTLGVTTNGISQDSGPVYFLQYADSSLVLDTTIWVDRKTTTYAATTDVNLRVNEAFKKHGIEIPYNYINVMSFEGEKKEAVVPDEKKQKKAPSKRYIRTQDVRIPEGSADIERVLLETRRYTDKQRLSARDGRWMELLSEEAIGIVRSMTDTKLRFWVEGSGTVFRIHIAFIPDIGNEGDKDGYKKLLSLSTSGRNEAINTFSGKIREIMAIGIISNTDRDKSYKWSLSENPISEDEIGESLLAAVADDVRVSATREKVELVVEKQLEQA